MRGFAFLGVTSREFKRGEAPLREKPFPPLLTKERGIKGERLPKKLKGKKRLEKVETKEKKEEPPEFRGALLSCLAIVSQAEVRPWGSCS